MMAFMNAVLQTALKALKSAEDEILRLEIEASSIINNATGQAALIIQKAKQNASSLYGGQAKKTPDDR